MKTETILAARAEIEGLTPLPTDCGALCACACCQPDEDGQGGVYLFPGEVELFPGDVWYDVIEDRFAPMIMCKSACPRECRPLACRIFPLTPVFSDEKWTVRMDARSRAMCPLAKSGVKGVRREFALAARRAIRVIASDPEGEAFLRKWQALEEDFRSFTL